MQHRSNKMKLLSLFGVVTAAVMILASCAPASQPAGPGGAKEPEQPAEVKGTLEPVGQRGGKLTMGAAQTIFGIVNDPHVVATASGRVFAVPVANGLLKRDLYDPQNPIVGELVEKWDVSKDGLTYTFKMKQGIKFQNVAPVNGREFTSEDAKYTLLRLGANPSVVPEKALTRFQRKAEFSSIKSIETPDKYTMVVTLKEPYAPFLDSVSHPGSLVIPKEFIDKFPDGLILEGMVGTGPFIPTEFKNQQVISYKKNPDYWKKDAKGGQLPYLDEATFIAFADVQTDLSSFRARQIDATESSSAITKSMIDSVTKGDPNVKVLVTPRASINLFRFNTTFKPFQDVRVRRAIHLAIDRYQFRDLLSEGMGLVQGPATPFYKDVANTADWLPSQPGYRKDKKADMEEAKRLLKEAGYGDGLTFGAMLSAGGTSGDTAALVADQLKPLNITVKADLVDYAGQWLPRSINGEFEFSYLGHTVALDVDSLLSTHIHSKGGRNYGKFNDPKLDDLIDKQRTSVLPEERKRWAQEAEKYILETAPIAVLYTNTNVKMVHPWAHNVADGPVLNEYESVEMAWIDKR